MQIRLNGIYEKTDCKTLHALKEKYYEKKRISKNIQIVTILEGYQTVKDLPLQENAQVVLIPKGEIPSREELESMMSARLTPGLYEKFQQGRVAVAGLGGLGSQIALHLARSGVGHLHLIDFDIVEPSNLNRQQYRMCHLGMYKTEALRAEIAEITPYVTVSVDRIRVMPENCGKLFADDDIICEAFDDPAAKAMIADVIAEQFPGKYFIAASGMAGCEDSNTIKTRRLTDHFYLCGDGVSDARPGRGLMAPRVAICAGHQANMVLRILAR